MNTPDVFSSLFKWAHRQGENFTSDAFAFVLRHIIGREPQLADWFIGQLCSDHPDRAEIAKLSSPVIKTQSRSEFGIPDLWIEAADVLILVEIKTRSGLHPGQLQEYNRLLQSHPHPIKRLVLLTAWAPATTASDPKHVARRWHQVDDWLKEFALRTADSVILFVIDQFGLFLRNHVMAIDRIDWQYVEGTKSLFRLTAMLEEACRLASVPTRASPGMNWRGFGVGQDCWVGIYMDKPEELVFQYQTDTAQIRQCLETRGWGPRTNGTTAVVLDLTGEVPAFLALKRDSQLRTLKEFVERAFHEATQCGAV